MSEREDWTPAEAAMPAVARVAGDAVARHERRFHAEAPTCPHCGAEIRLEDDDERTDRKDA
jgi:hypothetical protein